MRLDIGEGYLIRSFEPDDVDSITKYASNRKVWAGLRDLFPYPYTRKDAISWLARVERDEIESHFAIASTDEVIGGIGITLGTDIHKLAGELGYWLGEPFWGRGITTRSVQTFTEYTFDNYDILRVFAHVYSNNMASARVLEKAGYVCEGRLHKYVIKDGKVLDMLVYAVVR